MYIANPQMKGIEKLSYKLNLCRLLDVANAPAAAYGRLTCAARTADEHAEEAWCDSTCL